ncbi:MAG TPA: bifunctional DNA-formamidopyrimidine glycosylase/DNA-(apurinic or apyrimidinic site) lyase [Thermoguttaceae bacterium]
MPELPEVETMCRHIAPVVGCRIGDIKRPKSQLQSIIITPRLQTFSRRIKGQVIVGISRIGKRVILELEHGERIVMEPRMTGLILLDHPPDKKHLRLVFHLSGKSARKLLFWDQRGLGVVRLLTPQQLSQELGSDQIGPDALHVTPQILSQRLGHGRRPIKVALMDQHALAGVGNLYASEILHQARIHPAVHCSKLKPPHWTAIHKALRNVLREAIRHEGSTLRDGTYRVARNQSGNYQHMHRVYQRAGEQCRQCGKTAIMRIVQAQRSTFFCPECQRKS